MIYISKTPDFLMGYFLKFYNHFLNLKKGIIIHSALRWDQMKFQIAKIWPLQGEQVCFKDLDSTANSAS